MKISEIKITKLFGIDTFTIKEEQLKDNKLIIVSENGGGKSTILKILYYFLSKQWNELAKINFEKIEVTIDEQKYFYNNIPDELKIEETNIIIKESINNDLIIELFEKNDYKLNEIKYATKEFCIENDILENEIYEIIEKLEQKLNVDFEKLNVLYLPTYRRAENSFLEIHKELNKKAKDFLLNNFEVNLRNEENKTKTLETKLDDFFKDLWTDYELYKNKDKNNFEISEYGTKDIENIIRIYIENTKEIEKDINLSNFINTCSQYLSETKEIKLIDKKLKLYLNNSEKEIRLNELSSGEKQIISLFTYLYLTNEKYYVIFDEPELSISIFWQENLLEDISNTNNLGFLVATHSPYIFKKNNMQNIFSINDFK